MMGEIIGDQDSQVQGGYTSSMAERSIFVEQRVQLTRYWKEGGFESLDHTILICEIMEPYTYRSVRLACVGSLDDI